MSTPATIEVHEIQTACGCDAPAYRTTLTSKHRPPPANDKMGTYPMPSPSACSKDHRIHSRNGWAPPFPFPLEGRRPKASRSTGGRAPSAPAACTPNLPSSAKMAITREMACIESVRTARERGSSRGALGCTPRFRRCCCCSRTS